MKGQFKSIKDIINNLQRVYGDIVKDVTEEDVILDSIELMGIVGFPDMFEEKITTLDVKKYRSELPCDLYEINQIKVKDCPCDSTISPSTYIYDIKDEKSGLPTYKVQNRLIYFSFETGSVTISYQAVKTDEDGFPMVVDDAAFSRALESYVAFKRIRNAYYNGKIKDRYIKEDAEQDYMFNIAQTDSKFHMPNPNEFEHVADFMNSFIFSRSIRRKGLREIGGGINL